MPISHEQRMRAPGRKGLRRVLVLAFGTVITWTSMVVAGEHPYVLVTRDDFPRLRSRAERWPWSVMREKALLTARTAQYDPSRSFTELCYEVVPQIAGSCALAYILDPDNKSLYIDRVVTELAPAIHAVRIRRDSYSGHGGSVTPANAAYHTYLALDVMYDDIPESVRVQMEEDCDYIAEHHEHSWELSEYAIKGLRELYHNGLSPAFERYVDLYRRRLLGLTSEDGVFVTGPGYANSRVFMDNRIQKKTFLDICEIHGYHRFYNDPKVQSLYEWVLGYSVTPFNRTYTFGDSPPTKSLDHWSVAALRAHRLSRLAQAYASWFLGPLTDEALVGDLLHFVLCDTVPEEARPPRSRVFRNGGAWLLEDVYTPRALAGALWNISTEISSHTHLEANAIHIAAYGEHVLRNSGYDGAGKPNAELWEWIHSTAISSNTLVVNHRDHLTWRGGGISAWLLGMPVEFACGHSPGTIAWGVHDRNLIFVKPTNQSSVGYFAVYDEVYTGPIWGECPDVSAAWHPNSRMAPQFRKEGRESSWEIDGCNWSGHRVFLSLFLVTRPDSVEIRDGYFGSYEECSRFFGKYLYVTYHPQLPETTRILTVFLPYDDEHPLPETVPLAAERAEGVAIQHGQGATDYAWVLYDTARVSLGEVEARGELVWWREDSGVPQAYFARNATLVRFDSEVRGGFAAEHPISIVVHGDSAAFLSQPGRVRFFENVSEQIELDGALISPEVAGPGWFEVRVDSGVHKLKFRRGEAGVEEKAGSFLRSFELLPVFPNPFNNSVRLRFYAPTNGFAQLDILDVRGRIVDRLFAGRVVQGWYTFTWRPRDQSSGVYLCRFHTDGRTLVRKFVYAR